MKKITPSLLCDFYKISHRNMYPSNTQIVYSTWTPRASRIEGIDQVVNFGLQSFIKTYLIDYFNENFFNRNKDEAEYPRHKHLGAASFNKITSIPSVLAEEVKCFSLF